LPPNYRQAPAGGTKPGGPPQGVEKRKRESILDLNKYLDKAIRVKFAGGREVSGVLKGFDPLLNLVLDTTTEYLRGQLSIYRRRAFCVRYTKTECECATKMLRDDWMKSGNREM
jgi:small nuclear ribonucleoprotein (snRNP)-like protein